MKFEFLYLVKILFIIKKTKILNTLIKFKIFSKSKNKNFY